MSIQWPEKRAISDRKYHEAGVRGRFESNLRILRGRVSPAPAILSGAGFTVARNGVGDFTLTFSPAFSSPPSVTVTVEEVTNPFAGRTGTPTATTVQILIFNTTTNAAAENTFGFVAVGPT